MRKLRTLVVALAASAGSIPLAVQAQEEQVIQVPGFADFLAVDGESVWTTNAGRVERWSRKGKLAEVAMSKPCGAMAILNGSLWVADCKENALVRIDTRTARKTATIPTGLASTGELNVVAGAGSIWVASDNSAGAVSRVDPATNTVIATIPVNPGTWYLAFGYGSVWAVSSDKQSIQRIDPATNAVVKTTALGKQPGFLAAGEGAVWVQEQGDGTVVRIDPKSGDVTGRVKVGAVLKYGDIDTGAGMVWLRTTEDQTFVAIDPKSMKVRARVGKAEGSGALRFTKAGLWTSAHDVHTLTWWPKPAKLAK
ncbi:YncE family protein [Sphingomonas sp. BT-65]|uniref:Vgb family protein n=1 Tax=Sphingomonas sp. BT-65 TaxID=2989821 RepID=UPI002236A9A7|nr:YncE family protein [Sphingomonas sp. BT-65]MCW4462943.1 YncE family protein [Sphingomonas sp. BT-65]